MQHDRALRQAARMSLGFSSLSVEMVACTCPVLVEGTARLVRGFFVLREELGNTDTVSTCATHKAMGPDAR